MIIPDEDYHREEFEHRMMMRNMDDNSDAY